MPTRSPRSRPGLRGVLLAVAGLGLLSPSAAHDVAGRSRARDARLARRRRRGGDRHRCAATRSRRATLPGVLDTGQNAPDQRGLGLEHAAIGAGLRLNDMFGANLAVGWHVGESAHLEAAWVQARWATDAALLTLGAGRTKVPMGSVLTDARRLRPLLAGAAGQARLAEQRLVRRRCRAGLARRAGIRCCAASTSALWRGTGFPGGGDLPVVPSLHVQLAHGRSRSGRLLRRTCSPRAAAPMPAAREPGPHARRAELRVRA